MHSLSSSAVVIWILIIFQSNISSAQSELVEINEPVSESDNWHESEDNPNLAKFNSVYLISINEENLTSDKRCTGNCDLLDDHGRVSGRSVNGSNQCPGNLLNCWFQSETDERKEVKEGIENTKEWTVCWYTYDWECYYDWDKKDKNEAFKDKVGHTGNMCKCRCNRNYNPDSIDEGEKLLDSICFDPVSVDEGYVATGAKFTKRDNVIHLQLKQAKLLNGRIIETGKKWTNLKRCSPANTKPVYDIDLEKYLEIKLEDIKLPEDAVVTGVTLGDSVRGRYLNENGNIDRKRGEIIQRSQCDGRPTSSVFSNNQVKPSTGISLKDNNVLSKPCKSHMSFLGSSKDNDKLPYIVPYVDLREIVTNPTQAIRGIGWFHRGFSKYGGFFAVKIFK